MSGTRLALAALALIVAAGVAPAGDKENELIDKAVKAHGGADALAKAQTVVRSAKGALTQGDTTTQFTDQLTLDLPDRWRYEGLIGQTNVQFVINKDKGWQSVGGMTTDINDKRLAEMKDVIYVQYLATLLPLKKDSTLTVGVGSDEQVNGRKALVLNVASKGRPDVVLYFDAETHLLVKALVPKARQAGLTVKMEYYYDGHKEFGGVKLPTRQTEHVNGKKFSEIKEASYKFPDKVDAKLFDKP